MARSVFFDQLGLAVEDPLPDDESGRTVGEELLAVHRTYLPSLRPLLADVGIHGLAHITGGGLVDNLPRVLPEGCRAKLWEGSWPVPRVFDILERRGGVSRREMLRVFNMGVGMVAFVDSDAEGRILERLKSAGESPFVIGEVVAGDQGVGFESGG